jgi:hypothetical protein
MSKHVLLVFTDPVEGREDEYNAWYDQTHLKEVLQVDGFVAGQRFKVADVMPGVTPHRYVALYELDTDDPAAAVKALGDALPTMHMSDALDRTTAKMSVVTACTDRLDA